MQNRDIVRQTMKTVAKAYESDPERLREYFDCNDELLAGVATSAYHRLTGIVEPMQRVKFGGIGAVISQSDSGLEFRNKQLWFADIKGTALWSARSFGYALQFSRVSGQAMRFSINSDDALMNSEISGQALIHSINTDNAAGNCQLHDQALQRSENTKKAVRYCDSRSGDALVGALYEGKLID